jgi:hypothetical protein
MTLICSWCKEEDSIVSVEELISQYNISVVNGTIHYDGTSEKQIHSEVVDYQCVVCDASFSESAVIELEVVV